MRELFIWGLSLFLILGSLAALVYFLGNVRRK